MDALDIGLDLTVLSIVKRLKVGCLNTCLTLPYQTLPSVFSLLHLHNYI